MVAEHCKAYKHAQSHIYIFIYFVFDYFLHVYLIKIEYIKC